MYTCIVVGTDGSQRALDAVGRAGKLAELVGLDKIHVVTACDRYTQLEIERINAGLPEEFQFLVRADVDALERFAAARSVLDPKLEVVEHEKDGHDPAGGILSVADQVGADLIVVGARGLGAVGRFLRGSVSTKVAHHAPCDVLIVEHDE